MLNAHILSSILNQTPSNNPAMPANAYRPCDMQFVESVHEHTIQPFVNVNLNFASRIERSVYDIIEEVDAIVERFRGYFPENNQGISVNIYTLPPKVMLHCVCNNMFEMVTYEKAMIQYGQPYEEIYLFQKYHFRLLSHSLQIFNRVCQRFIANNCQPIKTRHASTPDVVLGLDEYRVIYNTFRFIVQHIHDVYAITFPTTLTHSEMPIIDSLIMKIEEYEFIQESVTTPTPELTTDATDLHTEQPMDIEDTEADTDAETTTDFGDYFT